jgi:hypothetical protein
MVLVPYYAWMANRRFKSANEKTRQFARLHDEAIKFAWVYAGITTDDIRAVMDPDPLTRTRNRAALKRRDYRKWQLLCQSKYLSQPELRLRMKAEMLRVNSAKVRRRDLASALGISVPTLYRRYGRDLIRQVCDGRPIRAPLSEIYRYRQTAEICLLQNGNSAATEFI